MTYFEYNENATQGSTSFEVLQWPDLEVKETLIDADMAQRIRDMYASGGTIMQIADYIGVPPENVWMDAIK